jgi:hypothetical protein
MSCLYSPNCLEEVFSETPDNFQSGLCLFLPVLSPEVACNLLHTGFSALGFGGRRDEASASYEHQGYLLCVQNRVIGEESMVVWRVLAYMLEVSWNTLAKKNARPLAD